MSQSCLNLLQWLEIEKIPFFSLMNAIRNAQNDGYQQSKHESQSHEVERHGVVGHLHAVVCGGVFVEGDDTGAE